MKALLKLTETLLKMSIIGPIMLNIVRSLGRWLRFVWATFVWSVRPPYRIKNFFKQMEFIGVQYIPIIVVNSLFPGFVFALQVGKTFSLFQMQNLVGATVGLSLTRELGPVFAALMITARCCSSMAAEIGTMRVTEQIDALQTMAVDPLQYLVTPRVFACIVMGPLLTMVFNVVGVMGAYAVGVWLLEIPPGPFMHHLYWYVDPADINGSIVKAAVFGFFIASISCYKGFTTTGGAEGVGRATTSAVVASSVTVLVVDYFLTSWILEYFTNGTAH